jgi:hypothetical protein
MHSTGRGEGPYIHEKGPESRQSCHHHPPVPNLAGGSGSMPTSP